MTAFLTRPWVRACGMLAAGAVLLALYARGHWALGFVALLPWMAWLDGPARTGRRLLRAWLLCLAFAVAVFGWFGTAMALYAQWPQPVGGLVLLLIAPLMQPQLMAWALVRQALAGHSPGLRAAAASASWVAVEWLLPKALGDTLGHGLYPAPQLRQAASLVGVSGLTLMLLLVNEALALALVRTWAAGGAQRLAVRLRSAAMPLGALLLPLAATLYGTPSEAPAGAGAAPQLRMGLVQANIADYERRRQAQGSYAVVREVLDTHYAMSYDAVERQRADAVLWSETIYPTTFGQPKSEAGAQLDQEIVSIVNAAGVPFVFGTYDRDGAGEYNAAAFVQTQQGLLGMYRKTRLFPLTETVPAWLDGPLLQRWLPWVGRWQPGPGARVFPLRLRSGQEVPVQPLICRDDTDPALALAGARLGARALLTMSNDAWFSADPLGAQLHQAVAAFRSIETGLPQFRVTTNGYSAVIDVRGTVHASGDFGRRTLVVGALPVPDAPPTLLVRWGDWVGPSCLGLLGLFGMWGLLRRWGGAAPAEPVAPALAWPVRVRVLPAGVRWPVAVLRGVARLSLLALGAAWGLDEGFRSQGLQQLRLFGALVVAPELAAVCLLAAWQGELRQVGDRLQLWVRGAAAQEWSLVALQGLRVWSLPWPGPGLTLVDGAGKTWHLVAARPQALEEALTAAGAPGAARGVRSRADWYAWARQWRPRLRLARPVWKFVVLPLVLATPAFALHQHIAYGGFFGELYSYGAAAYVRAFALWWAAWALGVAVTAAVLRLLIEGGAWVGLWWRPQAALQLRLSLEQAGLALLYAGLPLWLLMKMLGH